MTLEEPSSDSNSQLQGVGPIKAMSNRIIKCNVSTNPKLRVHPDCGVRKLQLHHVCICPQKEGNAYYNKRARE